MIERVQGNVVTADAEALVNTVNCVGHMGKGIALQFKKAFPENFKFYQHACRSNQVQPGKMLIFNTGTIENPKYIINFPTKRHWRERSIIEDIETGLIALVEDVQRLKIKSIAIPPLGCGLGGLNWTVVKPMIESAFSKTLETLVVIFEPIGSPEHKDMPVRTERPKMTVARALFIRLMQQYSEMSYRLTLLEIQKLAYLLQEAGEPLRLKYEAGHYGPYAHNLNKVLEVLEAHYIKGYGDSQKPDIEITLLPGAIEEARSFLSNQKESSDRLKRVSDVIEGFETPYGMELLSSVHWVTTHGGQSVKNVDEAIKAVHKWTPRKRNMFKPDHIQTAWDRLESYGWLI